MARAISGDEIGRRRQWIYDNNLRATLETEENIGKVLRENIYGDSNN